MTVYINFGATLVRYKYDWLMRNREAVALVSTIPGIAKCLRILIPEQVLNNLLYEMGFF